MSYSLRAVLFLLPRLATVLKLSAYSAEFRSSGLYCVNFVEKNVCSHSNQG